MTKPARFSAADLTRALKAADKAGVRVRVRFEPDGTMEVWMLSPGELAANPLDAMLK